VGTPLEIGLIVPQAHQARPYYLLRRFRAENERIIAEMLAKAIP